MRGAFWAVWLLAGCKTTHVLDASSQTASTSAATLETHETRQAGPEHIVMTVEEFSQLCDPKEVVPSVPELERGLRPEQPMVRAAIQGVVGPPSGPLIRRTVTVTDRGPSLDDLRSLSGVQTKLNAATEIKTKDTFGFLTGIWPWLLGGGLALAVSLLKPAWISWAWSALKALFGRKT